jgi:CO dehydrogenase/acetyl-CoA synthase epsilon subunit
MIAGKYNILCEQGTTFTRVLVLEQPTIEDPTVFEPYDLTDHTARMQVRRTVDSSSIVVSLTTENERISIDGEIGQITLYMSDEVTSGITSSGVYDLEIIDNLGNVSRVIEGVFTLSQEVTR